MIKNICFFLLKILLFYSVVFIELRNFLFDLGLLRSKSFSKKIISIGNLSMGGAGKTPVEEYIIKLLSKKYKVALLCRGYKSKNKNFHELKVGDNPFIYGDEVVQIKNKYPGCLVFSCRDKIKGLNIITSNYKEVDVILLDDGYQKRSLNVDLNILLIDEKDYYDSVFPFGKLREPLYRSNRAHLIIYTKSSSNISLKNSSKQHIFHSNIDYLNFYDFKGKLLKKNIYNFDCLAISGIAKPHYFNDFLKLNFKSFSCINFQDHHNYKSSDIDKILNKYKSLRSNRKVIITTEKDYVKLSNSKFKTKLVGVPIYFLPICFKFDNEKKMSKIIFDYVK